MIPNLHQACTFATLRDTLLRKLRSGDVNTITADNFQNSK